MHASFEGFVVGPYCPVQYSEGCLFGFRRKLRKREDTEGIPERLLFQNVHSIPHSCAKGRRGCIEQCSMFRSVFCRSDLCFDLSGTVEQGW
jgi:hypothetical protein